MPKIKGKIPRITFRAVQPFNLSDENWRTIEEAYRQPTSQQVRAQITVVTSRFLQLAVAENTALMDDAIKRISRLRQRALSLNDAIKERPIDDPIREYVDEEVAFTYALLDYDQPLPARNYVDRISLELGRFVKACDEVLGFAPKYDYWPDGGAWEIWIRQLTGILKMHNLPTGVRKDSAKLKEDKFSAFAIFVQTLQKFIPPEHIRAQNSLFALSTAIDKARTKSKPLVAPRKLRVRKPGRNTSSSRP